jgi:hypothetical protein
VRCCKCVSGVWNAELRSAHVKSHAKIAHVASSAVFIIATSSRGRLSQPSLPPASSPFHSTTPTPPQPLDKPYTLPIPSPLHAHHNASPPKILPGPDNVQRRPQRQRRRKILRKRHHAKEAQTRKAAEVCTTRLSTASSRQPADHARRYDLTTTFTVLVGAKPHRQRFTVHHDLITQRSEFFRAARSLCWTEPGKVTRLVDDDPHVFSAYLSCVYFGKDFMDRQDCKHRQGDISSDDEDDDEDEDGVDSNSDADVEDDHREKEKEHSEHLETVRFLVDVYLLADKLLDPTTANVVIEELRLFVMDAPWTTDDATISHVYASTGHKNPLRKLIRDWYLFKDDQSWALDRPKSDWDLPVEFLQDLIIEPSRQRREYTRALAGLDVSKGNPTNGLRYAYRQNIAQ